MTNTKNLIIVAGHAAFKDIYNKEQIEPEKDIFWTIQPFQLGEAKYYIEHIKYGVNLLKTNPNLILIFSGGFTRESSRQWSEANSYYETASYYNFWDTDNEYNLQKRIFLEEYARDSFENLLFSICRYKQLTSDYPSSITIVSWKFKKKRFLFHNKVLQFPENKFFFNGILNPENLKDAIYGEKKALNCFHNNLYGSEGLLLNKKNNRNPLGKKTPYYNLKELKEFFTFINDPNNIQNYYTNKLPWNT